jgi:hypothetical protein
MKRNIIVSLILVAVALVITKLLGNIGNFLIAQYSPSQLENSNKALIEMQALKGGLFGLVALSWALSFYFLYRVWKPKLNNVTSIFVFSLLLLSSDGYGYYANKNEVEIKTIKPNWTAYLVPNKGANQDSQAKFNSKSYLGVEKIAAKSVEIPHEVLPKRGMQWDMYIPAATLYVVERQPYSRAWVKDSSRGTSKKDEGTYVESSESINIDFGTSIGASITEDDAATFLYTWGVGNIIDPNDSPEYPSVVYARKLEEIMDNYVYHDSQTMLAQEFGKNTLEYNIAHKAEIMAKVAEALITKYKKTGITIHFFGYASPLNFDKTIQDAINSKYIAGKNAEAVSDQMKSIPVHMGLAEVEIKKGIATAISKFDGKINLPSFVVLPEGLLKETKELLRPTPQQTQK